MSCCHDLCAGVVFSEVFTSMYAGVPNVSAFLFTDTADWVTRVVVIVTDIRRSLYPDSVTSHLFQSYSTVPTTPLSSHDNKNILNRPRRIYLHHFFTAFLPVTQRLTEKCWRRRAQYSTQKVDMWTWPDSSFIKLSSERLSACLTTRRSHRSSLEAARKMGQEKTARACTASLLLAIIAPLASLLPTSDEGTDHSFEGWRVGGMFGTGEWTRVLGVGGGGKGSFRLSCAVVVAVVSKSMKLTCAVVTASARALLILEGYVTKNILFRFASRALLNTRLR